MIRLLFNSRVLSVAIITGLAILISCQQVDETPPILILKGDTLVTSILNNAYNDQGATATDETDGNITSNIFVENRVNINRVNNYTITYRVIDNAGNEAVPLKRYVQVYNQARSWIGQYTAAEMETNGQGAACNYSSVIQIDSSVNYRIVFYGFACNPNITAFANISDTLLIMPYQEYQDSTLFMSVQGSGWINDSTMYIEYQRKTNGITSYWNATFNR